MANFDQGFLGFFFFDGYWKANAISTWISLPSTANENPRLVMNSTVPDLGNNRITRILVFIPFLLVVLELFRVSTQFYAHVGGYLEFLHRTDM